MNDVNSQTYPSFNAVEDKSKIIDWIRRWFDENGKEASAVIGISGGKDSTITAALCVKALGRNRVFGILMPNGDQADIKDSIEVVEHLGINHITVNIEDMYNITLRSIADGLWDANMISPNFEFPSAAKQNLAPRLRMATLYAFAQVLPNGGRVANTCNASEDYVGYSTKYGDAAGDFAPLASYTVDEVLAIGDICDIPKHLVHKAPSDGLCGETDEDNLGFTYAALDKYIKTGICENEEVKKKIDRLHTMNLHKLKPIPTVERN